MLLNLLLHTIEQDEANKEQTIYGVFSGEGNSLQDYPVERRRDIQLHVLCQKRVSAVVV